GKAALHGLERELLACKVGLTAMLEHDCAHLVAQPNRSREVASLRGHGFAYVDGDRATSRKPLIASQDRSGAPHRHRHDWNACLAGNQECAEMEPEEARPARERALREGDDALAGAGGLELVLRVLDAALRIDAAHEQRPEPAQERSRNPLLRELLLGDERERARNGGYDGEGIEIARMIGNDHDAGIGHLTLPLDLRRRARRPQEEARSFADDSLPPMPPGQCEHGRPDGARDGDEQRPPVAGVGQVDEPVPRAPGASAETAERQPRDLPPKAALALSWQAALIEGAGGGPADLTARGLGHGARRHQLDDVGRHVEDAGA